MFITHVIIKKIKKGWSLLYLNKMIVTLSHTSSSSNYLDMAFISSIMQTSSSDLLDNMKETSVMVLG